MIKWYDYVAAFIVADFATTSIFLIPFWGGIVAYLMVFYAWDMYCEWRLKNA